MVLLLPAFNRGLDGQRETAIDIRVVVAEQSIRICHGPTPVAPSSPFDSESISRLDKVPDTTVD